MHANALIHEKSPYLRQHAQNPVDWMPWGDKAFEKARNEDKPIFLSVGYSTCHWCHVMAHESFEDEGVAEILNRDFVPVKVDREERPDVDRIYMLFVQASTGSGGWPMSVWLTPHLKPFFGGTYFPPDSRYGRPGFRQLLQQLAHAWKHEREKVEGSSLHVVEQLRSLAEPGARADMPEREPFERAFWQFRRMFDTKWGGFGNAPKFPRPVVLNYLLRYHLREHSEEALDMVTATLRAMAAGGMHDQLGGGFHRYSVDERWFVPHFEKMLYDQAQLAIAYLEAYQVTQDAAFADVARDIFSYVLRDLTDKSGAFYSAEDADSPDPENPPHSREGAFYVWKKNEVDDLLGEADAALFCVRYGVRGAGNVTQDPHGEFTGHNILYEVVSLDDAAHQSGIAPAEAHHVLERAQQTLFTARSKRPRPHLDSKILTSWNGLMISALAKGYIVLREIEYLRAAQRAASFLLSTMYDSQSGRLLRRFCEGEAAVPAFLDDYAFFIQALLDLFEASFESLYVETAIDLAHRGLAQFEDNEQGGFFSTIADANDLLLRMKDDYDGAESSGNSVAADVLLRLAHLTGDTTFSDRAKGCLRWFAPRLGAQPTMAPQALVALGRWLMEPEQVIIRCAEIGPDIETLLAERHGKFSPYSVALALSDAAANELARSAPFLASLERKGRITVYECRNFVCELPKVMN
ncbi:MAG: thioredoxin domain-containing protein [Acidobacteriaceae bacterium]|nr:thioredoxin domain-containing protein [Acidobacteriaceae bacterium]MBV9778718.1 thioredoxin domain-containing protein [Acidobacteriaceae bacterium]